MFSTGHLTPGDALRVHFPAETLGDETGNICQLMEALSDMERVRVACDL